MRKMIGWPQGVVALLVVAVLVSLGGGYYQSDYDWREIEKQRAEILKQLPENPDILINITWDLMPGTPELTALGRKATRALVKGLLDNAEDGIRSVCAGVLSQIRDPDAAPALVEALADRNEMVRQQALIGLSNLADPSFGKQFARLLEDPEESYWVKQTAISAIGKVGYAQAIKLLFKQVEGDDQQFAWEAIAALWHMRNKASRNELVSIFMQVLKKEKVGANLAIDYLGELKAEEASKVLVDYYVGKDEHTKNQIILALGKIGDGKARAFLKDVLRKTQVARHLNNAAIALARLGDRQETIAILGGLLQDRKAYMRINAAFALGEIGAVEEGAVKALIGALEDRNDYVRSEAAVALGRIKAAAAAPALEKLANGENPFVALDAVIALNRIDFAKYRQLIFDKLLVHKKEQFRRIVERGIKFLAEQKDPAALPHLLAALRSYDMGDQASTLKLLRDFGKDETGDFAPTLLYLAHTTSYMAFAEVLRTIREWKQGDYVPALLERLYRVYYDNDKTLLYFTLGKIGDAETAKKLAQLKESSHTAWLYQQFALANLGDKAAADRLVAIVRDGTLNAKRDAAFLLGALDSATVVAPLELLMKEGDPFTAVAAASALLGHDHKGAFDFLYKVMKEGTPVVADEAARAFLVGQNENIDQFLSGQVKQEKDIVTKRRSEELQYNRAPQEFR